METPYIILTVVLTSLVGFYAGTIYRRIQMYNKLQSIVQQLEKNIVNLLEEVRKENNKTAGLIGNFNEKELLDYSLDKAVEREDYKCAAFIRDVLKKEYGDHTEFE